MKDKIGNLFLKLKEIRIFWQNHFDKKNKFTNLFVDFDIGSKDDISVIIPWKDVGIERSRNCLKSLRNQTYDQELIEIILVDYGSKEENSRVVRVLCSKYKVKYIRVDSVSLWSRAHALNIGIKNSKSKYILISDIDIIFEKNYIEECVKELQNNFFQVLYTPHLEIPSQLFFIQNLDFVDNYYKVKKKCFTREKRKEKEFSYNPNYRYGMSICCTLAFFYKFIGGYDEFYKLWGCEDDDIIKRFELMGLEIKDISDKTSHLHQWHKKFEGLESSPYLKEQILKNREYFQNSQSILRNLNGWGEY